MIPDLLTETTLLTPTETTQPLERDHHKPHGRIQERGDSPLSSSPQPVREQRPPRTLPRPLAPRDEGLIHQFVQVLSEGVVGEHCLGEYMLESSGVSISKKG